MHLYYMDTHHFYLLKNKAFKSFSMYYEGNREMAKFDSI